MKKAFSIDGIVFVFLMTIAVAISIFLKNENFFDIANYHYYNPWALLNNRIGYDVVPASMNGFLNPLLDLPRYLTIVLFNEHINWFYAINGLWFGGLLFVFYKIVCLFFNKATKQGASWIVFAMLIAITGRMVWFQVGSCTNEIILSFINLSGLYFLLKNLQSNSEQKLSNFIYAGLILGFAFGLKSVSITICVASGMSLIIGFKWLKNPLRDIAVFALCGLVGYLVANGWWMYKMYSLYDNPFFPFWNDIFKSAYAHQNGISMSDFVPSWKQLAFCPYLTFGGMICNGAEADSDYRLQIGYTLAIIWLVYLIFSGKIKYHYKHNPMMFFFYSFLAIDYLLWAKIFSVQHYFIVVEMFIAVLIVMTLAWLYNRTKHKFVSYAVIYVFALVLLSVPGISNSFGSLQGRSKVIDVEPINLPNNTLIKLYNLPMAGLLPEIAKYSHDFRAVGYSQYIDVSPDMNTDLTNSGKFKEIIGELDKQYENQIVVFRLSANPMQARNIWDRVQNDLKDKKCRRLRNSFDPIFGQPIIICIPKDWDDISIKKK